MFLRSPLELPQNCSRLDLRVSTCSAVPDFIHWFFNVNTHNHVSSPTGIVASKEDTME